MIKKLIREPRSARWILSHLSKYEEEFICCGDLGEEFEERAVQQGKFRANLWYWIQVLYTVPIYLKHQIQWGFLMFRNYLKIALRNIKSYKVCSFINLAGLSIGLACSMIISLWIVDELNFDIFHNNYDTLNQIVGYRLADGFNKSQNDTPVPLAPALKEDFPEVVASSRYRNYRQILLKSEDKTFYENNIRFVDPSFLRMFGFDLLWGDQNSALDNPHAIVLTETAVRKYFTEENPVGQSLTFNTDYQLVVTGVLRNLPHNSTLQFDVLLPYQLREELDLKEGYQPSWGHNTTSTFVQLKENASTQLFDSKIRSYIKDKIMTIYPSDVVEKHRDEITNQVIDLKSIPFRNIRFAPSYGGSARVMYLTIFSVTAFMILLSACINFTNFSTARASKRAKEIGLRKVVGAQRKNLIKQFLSESILFSFIALLIAIVLFLLLQPVFSHMIGRKIPVIMLFKNYMIPLFLVMTIFTGFAGGLYPALILSSLQPVMTLKGHFISGKRNTMMKKCLVVFQFVVSVILMISTVIIYKQITYIKNINLGYDKEHVVCLLLNSDNSKYKDLLTHTLNNHSNVISITGSFQHPAYFSGRTMSVDWEGKDPQIQRHIGNLRVDYNYIKTMKINLLAGRDFSRAFPNDVEKNFIINEQMAKLMGAVHPFQAIGRKLVFNGREGMIVGVVEDFHYKPLNEAIAPAVITLFPDRVRFLIIRISPGDISSTLNIIQSSWDHIIPSYPFEYSFLDSDYDALYEREERSIELLSNFTILIVLITCLGLFGLTSLMSEQRRKEVGVRKVLGASVSIIVINFSKDFSKWILIANLIACPVAYYVMSRWLQNFAYSIKINPVIFLIVGIVSLILGLLTTGYQSVKAATTNPVDTLRYE